MKVLMLLRHAKSSWKDDELSDHERPLNGRGKKTGPVMGRLVVDQGLVPDLILSSTAVRARKTAEAVAKACGRENAVVLEADLYLATAGDILGRARNAPDEAERLMLVGHNPGMEDLVRVLSGRQEGFPTGALAVFDLAIDRWSALETGVKGKLRNLWRPKELD